jgi:hypothetical protein
MALWQEDFAMRPLFEEFEEFDEFDEFDFDDNPSVARLLREQRLEESRFASRKSNGPRHRRQFDNDEYDEREFDSYAGVGLDH